MNIKPNDLVLEIGSGDNPKPRSDVLCDKLPEDDTQRGGSIAIDRPFIAADGHYLPFSDKSFDYIICCHVLEHAEDPDLFISELMRVGKGGYIETPTEIGERLYGWAYHKWLINIDSSGKLIFKPKKESSQFGQLFHYLYLEDPAYRKFHNQNHKLFLNQYEWSQHIEYQIVEQDNTLIDLNNQDKVKALLNQQTKPGMISQIKDLVPPQFLRLIKSIAAQKRHRKNLKDIEGIIVCPSCKGALNWHDQFISCQNCLKKYPIRDGIPFLLNFP